MIYEELTENWFLEVRWSLEKGAGFCWLVTTGYKRNKTKRKALTLDRLYLSGFGWLNKISAFSCFLFGTLEFIQNQEFILVQREEAFCVLVFETVTFFYMRENQKLEGPFLYLSFAIFVLFESLEILFLKKMMPSYKF